MPNATYPLYTADRRRSTDGQLTQACATPPSTTPAWPAATSRSTPCSPSNPPFGTRRPAAADRRREVPEHRRPAERGRRSLELVLRRLGRRRRRPPRPAVPVPPPAVQLLRRLRPRPARPRPPQGRDRLHRRRAGTARCRRSASSSRTARRTSTPATPASPTAATTWSTCSRRSRPARRPATPWSSSPTTSSAASGTTCRRPAGLDHPGRPRRVGPRHPDPGAAGLQASMRCSGVDHTVYDTTSILATIEHSFGLNARWRPGRAGHRPGPRRRAGPALALTSPPRPRRAVAGRAAGRARPARQDGRGAYMMTATPTSARRAPATSYRSGR